MCDPEPIAPSPFHRSRTRRTPRGTAEIELLLVIPVLLIILFIVGGMLVLGPARILNVFQPASEAYEDATTAQMPGQVPNVEVLPSDIQLDPSLDDLQDNANRIHQATATKDVTITLGEPFWRSKIDLPTITLTDKAEFTSPAWAYSSWPAGEDSAFAEQWVNDYADQSTAPFQDPLMLAPAWPP